MNVLKRVALFSLDEDGKENIEKYLALEFLTYKNISFKEIAGCYKGQDETSYVAIIEDDEKLEAIFKVCAKHNQKCILVVDESRKAFEHDVLTGDVKELGKFEAIDALQAKELDCWSLIDTQYYGVIKRRA